VPLENKIKYFTTGHKERSCQSYSCREISKLCFLFLFFQDLRSIFFPIYNDLKRSLFTKKRKIWSYFMEPLGEKEKESKKENFPVVVWMRFNCVVYLLTAGCNNSQHRAVISQCQRQTHVSESFHSSHFLFMFLNTGYHCVPNPLLWESVFNKIRNLYWTFLVGLKNEKLTTEISLIIYSFFFLNCWRHNLGDVYPYRMFFIVSTL
jgi:hypothetical protein